MGQLSERLYEAVRGGLLHPQRRTGRVLLTLSLFALALLYGVAAATAVSGPTGSLAIIAGQNRPVVAGPATSTSIGAEDVVADSSGNLYIADADNDVVEKVTPSGTLSIIAGRAGQAGAPTPGGLATSSDLDDPDGVAVDGSGNVYIADTGNQVVEKVTAATGKLSVIAGVVGDDGAPTPGGPATSSHLAYPEGVAVDSSGNVYIADTDNSVVEKVTAATGKLSVIAGVAGDYGASAPGLATSSDLYYPQGVAVDSSGNVYIADTDNQVVEKVTAATGKLSIIAGQVDQLGAPTAGLAISSHLDYPEGVAVDSSGNVYIADNDNSVVEEVTAATGKLSIIAGQVDQIGAPTAGPAISSDLYYPEGVAIDSSGNVYIADTGNSVVEKVAAATRKLSIVAGFVYQGAPMPGPAISSDLYNPTGVAVDSSGNVYIADTYNDVVEEVAAATGKLSIIAGRIGQAGAPTPGGLATNSDLDGPGGVAVDGSGNVYIADTDNQVVEEVAAATGKLSVIAGVVGDDGAPAPGGLATSSHLDYPAGVAVDGSGNVYIADTNNQVVEKVTAATGKLSVIAGVVGSDGVPTPGGLAANSDLHGPTGVAVDSSGNVYIADNDNSLVEEVTAATGKLSVIAGVVGDDGAPAPGGLATSSDLYYPAGVAVDGSGNVYIADTNNQVVEEVSAATGKLSIIAGEVNLYGTPTPGGLATNSDLYYPNGVAVDSAGNLYIADTANDDVEEVFGVPSPAPIPTAAGSGGSSSSGSGSASSSGSGLAPASKTARASVTAAHRKGRAAANTVSCAGAGACTVTETLTAVETVKVDHKKKAIRKTVVVGFKTVSVAAGASQIVKLPLNGTGEALLHLHGKLSAKLTVKQGQQTLRVQTVTYTQPKKQK